jgi:hypothetical protein
LARTTDFVTETIRCDFVTNSALRASTCEITTGQAISRAQRTGLKVIWLKRDVLIGVRTCSAVGRNRRTKFARQNALLAYPIRRI